jgi:hypothetical protein
MMKKAFSALTVLGILAALTGASAPKQAEAMMCNAPWCIDGQGGGGGGGGGGSYCPSWGCVDTCWHTGTGEWKCKCQPC